ncbi:MAG: hypothetical protein ACK4OP_05890 [Gemmobacter sp.]
MVRLFCPLAFILAASLALPAAAQLPQPGAALTDFDELARLIDVAQAGTDPRITANAAEEPTRGSEGSLNPNARKLVLVSVDGHPAFVYHRRFLGNHDWQPAFTARCAGNGMIEVTAVLFDGGYSFEKMRAELGENPALSLTLDHANVRAPVAMPAVLERAFRDSRFFARYRGTLRADDPFLDRMQGAPYLWAGLQAGQRRLSPTGGSDISTYGATMRALVNQCRGIAPPTPTDTAVGEFRQRFLEGPSQASILDALQRKIASGMASGGAIARATQIRVVAVERYECHGVSEGRFLCRYKPEVMGDMSNPIIRMTIGMSNMAAPTWGLFSPRDGGWTLDRVYNSCRPNGTGGFSCTETR